MNSFSISENEDTFITYAPSGRESFNGILSRAGFSSSFDFNRSRLLPVSGAFKIEWSDPFAWEFVDVKDCWQILGLPPTADTDAIKKSYRELVKKYHPDRVLTPERKRQYTIICAQINEAYREASHQAKTFHLAPSDQAEAPAIFDEERPDASPVMRGRWYGELLPKRVVVVSLLVALIAMQLPYYFGMSAIRGFTQNIRIAFTAAVVLSMAIFVYLFVTVFIYGILFAGSLDMLVVFLFPRRLAIRLGLGRYENKLLWLFVLIINIAVFFLTDIVSAPAISDRTFVLYGEISRVIGATTLPLLAALKWARELIQYNRVKRSADTGAENL